MQPIASPWSITASSRIFASLREKLEKGGAVFGTETDTEIVLHLVDSFLKRGIKPVEAVKATLSAIARRLRARLHIRRRG